MQSSLTHSQPIRICFVAPKAYALFNPQIKETIGGAEVDLYMLATELAKDDNFEVSFVTADYGQPAEEIIEGVRVIKSLDFRKNPAIGAVRIWAALARADAQMYMVKTISAGTFLVALFCTLHNRHFLYRTAHSTHCDGTYLRQHRLKGWLYKRTLRTASLVFTQNNSDRQALRHSTGIDSVVIPNAHRLQPLPQGERKHVLWVGRSAKFKRPQLFIELARQLPAERFVMICQQATGDAHYERLADSAEQVANLQFIQRVDFQQIGSYFQQAKIFVNTSDAEGFPNTFIQACQYGVPILSLNVDPDGFLVEYGCGICCRGDTDRLVQGLKFLLAENRYVEIGHNARKYVGEKHDITRVAERYKPLLRGLIEKAKPNVEQ